jgi:hypothetical protein
MYLREVVGGRIVFKLKNLVGYLAPCVMLVSFLAYFSTLKIDATFSTETSVDFAGLHGVM